MTKQKLVSVKVWRLGWSGMEEVSIKIPEYPQDILKIDDWYGPQVGELCLNDKYEIDVVKSIEFQPSDGVFKATYIYGFMKSKTKISRNMVIRVEVKKGKVFVLNNKAYVHQEPLSGEYIEQMATGRKLTTP